MINKFRYKKPANDDSIDKVSDSAHSKDNDTLKRINKMKVDNTKEDTLKRKNKGEVLDEATKKELHLCLKNDVKKLSLKSPATYFSQENIGSKGSRIPISQRFRDYDNGIPGVGTYWIHPYYNNSVNKAYTTHNLKLKENILGTKLRVAPKETREQWAAHLKKHHQMSWFVNDGKGYVHC
ncbi:hypothetical protein JTB14_032706 [Gonioctena quinquepunctata]|nr:hypothetical protein JTB14_032706 [Gonioctena quinquepunctata]